MGGASVDWFDLADGGEAHLLTISFEANEEVTRTTSEGIDWQGDLVLAADPRPASPAIVLYFFIHWQRIRRTILVVQQGPSLVVLVTSSLAS